MLDDPPLAELQIPATPPIWYKAIAVISISVVLATLEAWIRAGPGAE